MRGFLTTFGLGTIPTLAASYEERLVKLMVGLGASVSARSISVNFQSKIGMKP